MRSIFFFFFFLGRAQTDSAASERANGGERERRTHNTKFSCVEMKCGANGYLRSSSMEVLDAKADEEKYPQGMSAPVDFGVARAL